MNCGINLLSQQKKGFCERDDSSCGDLTGGLKIAVLDQCSVVELPAEIHTELNRRFPKIRVDSPLNRSDYQAIYSELVKTYPRLPLLLIIFAFAFASSALAPSPFCPHEILR